MKIPRTTVMSLIIASMLISGDSAAAAASNMGVSAETGQILSKVTTAAGAGDFGNNNGEELAASFRGPQSVLVLPDGSVLVSDSKNHQIRKLENHKVADFAGLMPLRKNGLGFPEGGPLFDGDLIASVFNEPNGLAADAKGNIYIADTANHAIRRLDKSGQVTTLAGNGVMGNQDGKGKTAAFNSPQDVAVASDGTVYVADTLNHTIRKIAPDGTVTTITATSTRNVEVVPGQVVATGEFRDGKLAVAKFNEPAGLVLDAKGNLYISDAGNQRIRYIDFADGTVRTVAGSAGTENKTSVYEKNDLYAPGDFADGPALTAKFNFPKGLALTEEGGLVIADSLNHSVRYLFDGIVSTLAGDLSQFSGKVDAIERYARLHKPSDVAILPNGDILIADAYNNQIRKINLYSLPADAAKDDKVKVVKGSKRIAFDVDPQIVNGRTMVPVRAITEALGYKVEFVGQNQIVKLIKGNVTIELYIGQYKLKKIVQGAESAEKNMDAAPYISKDLTFVPLRFFSEEMGLDVQWNGEYRAAILRERLGDK